MSKKRKINPRNIPRTQADVDAAWERGVIDGVNNASAMFLMTLVDKYSGAEYVKSVWEDIVKLSEEVKERRVSVADLRRTLRDEYDIIV